MQFSQVKQLVIPQGRVAAIVRKTDGVTLWKGGHTNLVSGAIAADGSIFDGIGYREGYRLSSGGGLSAQAGTVTTGFIACTAEDLIRMGGVSWVPGNGTEGYDYCYISFYDSNFSLLGSYNVSQQGANVARGIVGNQSKAETDGDGITTFRMVFSDGSRVAWFRVNGYGSGSAMIVTVNEEILL